MSKNNQAGAEYSMILTTFIVVLLGAAAMIFTYIILVCLLGYVISKFREFNSKLRTIFNEFHKMFVAKNKLQERYADTRYRPD